MHGDAATHACKLSGTSKACARAVQLKSLAKDQVKKCYNSCIKAACWTSAVPAAKRENIEQELCSVEPTLKLLYTMPGEQTRGAIQQSVSAHAPATACMYVQLWLTISNS
jgi:superfamily II DNA helicase RecQ